MHSDYGLSYIYRLVDLDTWEVLYVGRTSVDIYQRMEQHRGERAFPHIRALFFERRIGAEEYAVVPEEEGPAAEAIAIADALSRGHPLVNTLTYGARPGWQQLPLGQEARG